MTDAEFDDTILRLVRSMHPDATTVDQLVSEVQTLRIWARELPSDAVLARVIGESIDRLVAANQVWLTDQGVKYQPQAAKPEPQRRLF